MMMTVSGVRARLELEPKCECDEMCTRSETPRAHAVIRHAIVDVLCGPVVNVVIGVHVFVLSVPLVVVRIIPILIL